MKGFQKLFLPPCKRYLFVLLLFFAVLLSLVLNQNNVYADTLSYTVDASNYDQDYIFSTECNKYSYWKIEFNYNHSWISSGIIKVPLFYGTVRFPGQDFGQWSSRTTIEARFFGDYMTGNLLHWCTISYQYLSSFYLENLSEYDPNWSLVYSISTDSFDGSPSGTLSITENGTYDVSEYRYANVDVVGEVVQGDYHDDLENLRTAIYTCGAVLLVLYFFYCIYRMIIRSTGGKR